MTLPAVTDQSYPTSEEALNQILSDILYIADSYGVVANVEVGSDHYIRAKAYANRFSIAVNNGRIALRNLSPLSATGDALVELAKVFGVTKRPAAKASGFVVVGVTGGGSVTIPANFLAIFPSGAQHVTITAATVSNGDSVEVIASSTGESGNIAAGTQGLWANSSVGNLKPTLTVDSGGIDGGEPEDDDERLRARLIRRLAFPGVGGNWSQIAQWAEESTASVEAAYVYQAERGPGSYGVAVTKAGGDRTLSSSIVNSVRAYVEARLPGHSDGNYTSVDPQGIDVVIDIDVPLPQSAGGSGNGWIDNEPWPSSNDPTKAKVTNVVGSVLTVNSTSADPPVAGKHFSIWNPAGGDEGTGAMADFVVLSVGGVSGAYTVTIDTDVSESSAFVTTGMYVSATCDQLDAYASEFAKFVGKLGPGEKTTSQEILPRGRRQPGTDVESPASLSNVLLGKLSDAHTEIADIQYAARLATGTGTTLTGPSAPTTTAQPPHILTLSNLAFRRLV